MNKYQGSLHSGPILYQQISISLFLCALLAQFFALTVAQAAEPGLMAAYSFDEATGTTATDASGYGNTGTISGASWNTPGKLGGALSFNGANWVTVNDADMLDFTSGMTLEAWVYPTVTPFTWTTVAMKEQPEIGNLVYGLFAGSPFNLPLVDIFTASIQELYGPAPIPINTWTHLAATYDAASGQSLYVNGVLVAQVASSGALVTSVGPIRIGGNAIWGEYFTGLIDEVRIYNRALNRPEILATMATPVGNCAVPPGYWQNHSWCTQTIQLGCVTYTKAQAIAIIRSNSSKDKTYSMAQQLIGAKLNIACKNTGSGCITSAIAAADTWLCAHPIGSGVKASSTAWQQITATYDQLVNYNAGRLCAPSCGN